MTTAEDLIKLLELKPHPEGGFYRETYRSAEFVDASSLPDRYLKKASRSDDDRWDRVTAEWQITEFSKLAQNPDAAKQLLNKNDGPAATTIETRVWSTSIYYLLTKNTFSVMHRLRTDEIYHFYCGDPLEMLTLLPDGTTQVVHLGPDVMNGQMLQHVVPLGVWQGSRVMDGGNFTLLGCTMSPGFEFSDYEEGTYDRLSSRYPAANRLLKKLTRK